MAVFNEPAQWDHTLGNNADTSTLPDDAAATAGIASLQKLFQIINATPLEAGGIAPDREDVNALFKYLGDQIFYTQNGGIPSYNAAYDYIPGRVVLYTDNNIYKCIQANGASSTVVAPGTDDTYWQQLDGENTSTSLIPNQIITSPVPLTDANLHLLDGALLSGSGAYAEYVTMMGALHDADPTANIWTDEATWQASVTSTGSCGKFVYDSVNNTLRLPKYDARYLKSTLSASDLGDLVNAQAPNIKGGETNIDWALGHLSAGTASTNTSGALTISKASISNGNVGSSNSRITYLTFDASNSNPIYSDSATTIDTDAVKVYYYIVLGTVSKTQIQIDIDNVMTDLALKADKDFSNVTAPTQAFKNMSVGWVLPDWSSAIDLSSYFDSANKIYTAPSNGFFFYSIRLAQSTDLYLYINNVLYDSSITASNDSEVLNNCVPVNSGDKLQLSKAITSLATQYRYVHFIPCKGV